MTEARLEPVEIQHVPLRRGLMGYARGDVDELLELVTASFEEVWYERDALRSENDRLQTEVARCRERDRLLGEVMRRAQKAAEETVAEARETAEHVLAKARQRADRLVSDGEREPERLREEIRNLTSFESAFHDRFRALVVALRTLEEDGAAGDGDRAVSGREA